MRRQWGVFCLFCLVLWLFSGCNIMEDYIEDYIVNNINNAKNTDIYTNDDTVSSEAVNVEENVKNVFYSLNKYSLKGYEPAHGCYLGAYILADRSVGYDMTMFEMKTLPHASYKYHLRLGEEYPLSWILSCYKEGKLPFVVISPDDENMPYNYDEISRCAKSFGALNIPMLIGFYPNPVEKGYEPELYKKFFSYARGEFKQYAPSTAFVFIEDIKGVDRCEDFFPDEEAVDWVGVDIYLGIKNDRIDNSDLAKLNFFYNKYQSRFPLMLSSLAVSSYTSLDHKYYTKQAAEEIKSIYTAVKERYPRIKAIYYMDFDSNDIAKEKSRKNDSFLITGTDQVTQGYKTAAKDAYFLNKMRNNEGSAPQRISLCRVAFQADKRLYIPYETAAELGFKCEKTPKAAFAGEEYADIFSLAQENGFSIMVDDTGVFISD